jgi:hypothetical protein
MQLLMMRAFDTSLDEALLFRPLMDDYRGLSELIEVCNGKDKRRPRPIPVDSDLRRMVLAALKNFSVRRQLDPKARLASESRTPKQSANHFYHVLSKCGINRRLVGSPLRWLTPDEDESYLKRQGLIGNPEEQCTRKENDE